jgi:hypothetical protein
MMQQIPFYAVSDTVTRPDRIGCQLADLDPSLGAIPVLTLIEDSER